MKNEIYNAVDTWSRNMAAKDFTEKKLSQEWDFVWRLGLFSAKVESMSRKIFIIFNSLKPNHVFW